jgi:hypothetical protein
LALVVRATSSPETVVAAAVVVVVDALIVCSFPLPPLALRIHAPLA